jgi:hypothetical protein
MKAYEITNIYWPGVGNSAIYSGKTASEAKGKAARTLLDVGGLTKKEAFTGLRCKRRQEFDDTNFPHGMSEEAAFAQCVREALR